MGSRRPQALDDLVSVVLAAPADLDEVERKSVDPTMRFRDCVEAAMDGLALNAGALDWTPEQASKFGLVAQAARHRVHQLDWWDDAHLVKLIGEQPREKLRVFQSGTDPTQRHRDHQAIDTEGANAEEILAAVKKGKLWVNLQRIDTTRSEFDQLGKQLYGELERACPHFHPVWINRAFLFVSSPGAMVYLHADYQPNMLWHMRGNKTLWIYPPYDERIVSMKRMEEICAGGEDDIPYRHEYDRYGKPFSIGPGETVSWPARAPHRVINGDNLNVSLSTFHETVEDYERVLEHRADYMLRQRMPWVRPLLSMGGGPMKRLTYRVLSRAGWEKGRPVKEYWARLRIDPEAPEGVSEIPGGPVLTEHSRLVKERGWG